MQSIERLLVLVEHYITTVEVGLLKTLFNFKIMFMHFSILMRSHLIFDEISCFESITQYSMYSMHGLSTFGGGVIYLLNDRVHGVT